MSPLRNTYVNCQTDDGRPVPWDPPDVPDGVRPDSVYFGAALAEMDRHVRATGLIFYVTQDLDRLPSYGLDVVVLLIGDEFTRVPSYVDRVRAIFRTLAVRPTLTSSVFREPSLVNLWSFVWYLRTWAHHLPGLASYRLKRRRGWTAPIWQLPVGVADQLPLAVKPPAERAHDLFFGGSIGHHHGAGAKELINPKVVSRRSMVDHAERLAALHPELSVELITTGAFLDSVAADSDVYSRTLMDSRIALVPRGTATDTFRLSQSLRYGCVAVVDTVPRHRWFYDGAPVVRLAGWDELEDVVVPLLADEARLEDLHRRSLDWWSERVSDRAVGRYMAERLNGLDP